MTTTAKAKSARKPAVGTAQGETVSLKEVVRLKRELAIKSNEVETLKELCSRATTAGEHWKSSYEHMAYVVQVYQERGLAPKDSKVDDPWANAPSHTLQ